jgi:hypothetical protein
LYVSSFSLTPCGEEEVAEERDERIVVAATIAS